MYTGITSFRKFKIIFLWPLLYYIKYAYSRSNLIWMQTSQRLIFESVVSILYTLVVTITISYPDAMQSFWGGIGSWFSYSYCHDSYYIFVYQIVLLCVDICMVIIVVVFIYIYIYIIYIYVGFTISIICRVRILLYNTRSLGIWSVNLYGFGLWDSLLYSFMNLCDDHQ